MEFITYSKILPKATGFFFFFFFFFMSYVQYHWVTCYVSFLKLGILYGRLFHKFY